MIGAEIRRYSSDRRGPARNVFLGIAGGALGTLAETLIYPTLILAFFVGELTNSFVVVGLVPAVGIGLWALARLPAAVLTGPQRRKLPWAVGASLVRAATMGLLTIVAFRTGEGSREPLLRSFFICYAAYSIAAGFASVPTAAVLAKAIPHDGRGLFFRQRAIWGGTLAVVAGLVVAQLLGGDELGFPRPFAVLFLAATVSQTATAFFVATLREPVRVAEARQPVVVATMAAVPRAMGDPNFRRFLVFRVVLTLAALADPFLVIFAVVELGVPTSAVGLYVVAILAGRMASAPAWLALARRHGERATLQVAALLRLVAPLLALILPYLAESDLYRDRVDDRRVLTLVVGVGYVAIGAAIGGQARGNFAYLAEIAPARFRSAYGGITNAALAVAAFAPVGGGLIVERWDYPALFLAATLVGLVAVLASGALTDTHVRTRPSAAAWRLRRGGRVAVSAPVPSGATPAEPRSR